MLLICLTTQTYGQYVRAPFSNEKINGKVISVTDIDCYNQPSGAVDTVFSIIRYNEKGEAIEQHIFKRYDKRFPKPQKPENISDEQFSQTLDSYFIYQYDKKGNKVSMTFSRNNVKNTFNYDKEGRLKKQLIYGADSEKVERITDRYDKNGKLLKITMYYPKENSWITQKYKYDANNLMTEENDTYNLSSRKFIYHFSNFDKQNNWTRMVRIDDQKREFVSYREIKYVD